MCNIAWLSLAWSTSGFTVSHLTGKPITCGIYGGKMLRCFGASGSPHISSAGISVRNHPQAQPQVLPLMRTLLPLGPQHPWRRVFQVGWANVQWPLHVIRNIYVIRHETPPVVSCTRTSCYAGDV